MAPRVSPKQAASDDLALRGAYKHNHYGHAAGAAAKFFPQPAAWGRACECRMALCLPVPSFPLLCSVLLAGMTEGAGMLFRDELPWHLQPALSETTGLLAGIEPPNEQVRRHAWAGRPRGGRTGGGGV